MNTLNTLITVMLKWHSSPWNNEGKLTIYSVHDDEYMSKKNYYGQAHEIREIINEQASIMINGKMKEYQVILSLLKLYVDLSTILLPCTQGLFLSL